MGSLGSCPARHARAGVLEGDLLNCAAPFIGAAQSGIASQLLLDVAVFRFEELGLFARVNFAFREGYVAPVHKVVV